LLFGKFPGFVPLSFWVERSVDEEEYGALVEKYGQGKTELLREKPVSLAFCKTT
jgi:hypothetical protein